MQVCFPYPHFHFISTTKAYSLFDERVSVQYVPLFVVDFEIIPDLFLVIQSSSGLF